ncbi:V-type ATP synthase subunit I [Treponema pectinovorum]|uniref:V-type ATP synthase subunit I n=1 Tax=Treponema pectinovorum TaxID=164 RepID=UPI0011F0FEE4|nr:V-type ATPase 116kDa subunit family protein [Treponema pectinovorum]
MIVPMKKISLVVLEKERRQALKALRKTGVVHVEELKGESEDLTNFKKQNSKVEMAVSLLSEIKLKKTQNAPELDRQQSFELADKILSLAEEKKNLFSQIALDKNELARFTKWGEINPEDFKYLSSKGVHLCLFELPVDKYSQIGENVDTLLVGKDKNQCRFFVISDHELEENERPDGLLPEAYRIVLPKCSTSQLKSAVEKNEERIVKIDEEIASYAKHLPSLKKACFSFEKDIELENLYSGMGVEEFDENKPQSVRLAWLTGYVPAEDFPQVEKTALENIWAIASSEPAEDDNVPTKLKNNKFVSLIYPVTDFLGTVPGYNEFDISNWFLLFFTIFFGMIFGDGGYGSILFLAGVALMLTSLKKKQTPAPFVFLLTLLGFATMVWGAITCTWFGLTPQQLPDVLKRISVPALSNVTSLKEGIKMSLTSSTGAVTNLTYSAWVKENLQIFCFTLALVQLAVAHVKGLAKNIKSPKFLGDLGSLLQVCGMYYVVLSMVVDGVRFPLGVSPETYYIFNVIPLPTLALGCIAFGFVMSFVFSNYDGSVLKSILESLKNIVSVLLGVVNVFSDIVSYIRLWAVALAGSAISATVNEMAGPLFGHAIMFIFAILILTAGHGLNMILNVLSVIVHGVRLNTLEFSTHLGMSWTGFKYKPFSE